MTDPGDKRSPTVTTNSAMNADELHTSSSVLLARTRWGVYLLLIAIAVGNMTGRLLAVNSVDKVQLETYRIRAALDRKRAQLAEEGADEAEIAARFSADEARLRKEMQLQRPFLSANDRSRWLTIRSLVEHGTYEVDAVVSQPAWDSIDKVRHTGDDGELHYYSSKPPLLATLLAGEYWVIYKITGWTLGDHPYEIGRFMLLTINILPLVLMYFLVARMVERLGESDLARIFVMACATLGTFLNTFAIVLNNHIVAAVSASIAVYALMRITCDGERRLRYFAVAGLAAAFTAASELPAASLLAFVGLLLLWRAPRETLIAFVPAVALIGAASFGTNWLAHGSLVPPYGHPDWYNYPNSHWANRTGIDVGEESKATYALHALVGHHGVFSLTPIWCLSIAGMILWLMHGDRPRRELAAIAAAVTVLCLGFYVGMRPQHDRNYGGMTSGFRWMFWCAPLWLVVMLPAVERLARSRGGLAFAALLLSISVLSASYPTWNPWTHPWVYNWMEWTGWRGF